MTDYETFVPRKWMEGAQPPDSERIVTPVHSVAFKRVWLSPASSPLLDPGVSEHVVKALEETTHSAMMQIMRGTPGLRRDLERIKLEAPLADGRFRRGWAVEKSIREEGTSKQAPTQPDAPPWKSREVWGAYPAPTDENLAYVFRRHPELFAGRNSFPPLRSPGRMKP